MAPDDAAAEARFFKTRWPAGVRCWHRNSDNVQQSTKSTAMPYQCRPCRNWYSVKTGTPTEGSKLGPQIDPSRLQSHHRPEGCLDMRFHRDLKSCNARLGVLLTGSGKPGRGATDDCSAGHSRWARDLSAATSAISTKPTRSRRVGALWARRLRSASRIGTPTRWLQS